MFAAFVALLGGGGYVLAVRHEAPVTLDSYEYIEVTLRDFRRLIQVEGQAQPDRVHSLTAPAAAVVRRVRVSPGDDVKQGAVLVELDSLTLRESLDEAQSELINARFALEEGRLTARRSVQQAEEALREARSAESEASRTLPEQEKLYQLGGISRSQLEEARQKLEDARRKRQDAEKALEVAREKARITTEQLQARLEAAQRAVQRLNEQLARLTVRAPVSGRVLALSLHVGDEVKSGEELVRLADLSRQHVEANVPALQASQVAPGQPATVTVDGRAYPARVDFVSPEATRKNDASVVAVRLRLDQPVSLRPFAPVAVEILTGVLKDQPAVRRGAFYTSGDGAFVYVMRDDGRRAVRRQVRYGLMDGLYIQVVEGLKAGERIIYSSYLGFRDKTEVLLAPEGGRPR